MARTIYYWFKRSALDTGHAGLLINAELYVNITALGINAGDLGQVYDNDLYVSWLLGTEHTFFKGYNGVTQDLAIDQMTFGAYKVHRVDLGEGLDRPAMVRKWREIRDKPGAHWRITNKNCATVVRRVLKAGGCDTYVRRWDLKHGMFSPQKVYHYAKNARDHLPGVG